MQMVPLRAHERDYIKAFDIGREDVKGDLVLAGAGEGEGKRSDEVADCESETRAGEKD